MRPPPALSRRRWMQGVLGTAALGTAALGTAALGTAALGGCDPAGATALLRLRKGVMALRHHRGHLLWLTGPTNGTLFRAPLNGEPLRALVVGLNWPRQFSCHDGQAWIGCQDQLLQVSLAGSARRSWPAEQVVDVIASTNGIYWTRANGNLQRLQDGHVQQLHGKGPAPSALAVHRGVAYWASGQPATLMSTSAAGETRRLSQQQAIYDLRVHRERLLFLTTNALMHMPLTGGTATPLLEGLRSPSQLTLHGDDVYLIDGPAGTTAPHRLLRASLAGGAATVLAEMLAPQALAVAAEGVYVADSATRRLWRYGIG